MGRLVEGLWDCPYCGTKGVRGSISECPNCASPRDEDTTFYLPGTIRYVPKAEAGKVNRNPDWICPYCNRLNSDSLHNCKYCGSERTKKNHNYFTFKASNEDGRNNRFNEEENEIPQLNRGGETEIQEWYPVEENKQRQFPQINYQGIIAVFLIIVMIVGMVYVFVPKNEEITITGFAWERAIEIERYQTVNESGWSVPANARLQYTRTEFSHYKQVFDHYETKTRTVPEESFSHYETYVSGYRDLGNGYFEEITSERAVYVTEYVTETYTEPVYRDEPVYATKYYYEIDKWLYERTVRTSEKNQTPYWGETNLKEDERVSHKTENYTIIGLNSKDKERIISLEYSVWTGLFVGQTVELKISVFGTGELVE